MKSKQRHSGGSYRRMKTMKSMYVKPGKDRKKARKSMTKLEQLLRAMEEQNDPKIGTVESFRKAEENVAEWVYRLWKQKKLDPSNIKL